MGLVAEPFSRLPLRGLVAFEAAARHGTFSAAARELAMTQAAISQHIAHLEADVGVPLFERRHRGIALTETGQGLLPPVREALHTLSGGMATARQARTKRAVNILTDFGFAAWWLMPRIGELSDLMPNVDIRLTTLQSHGDALGSDFDLAILFGDGSWPGCDTQQLFAEDVFPVCAPRYLSDRRGPVTPQDLAAMRLLHLRGAGAARWFEWSDWFAGQDANPPPSRPELVFNNYQIVLQAALLGQGVALGWAPLVDEMVASGSLIRLSDRSLVSARGYHLIHPLGRPTSVDALRIKAWLADAAPRRRPVLA